MASEFSLEDECLKIAKAEGFLVRKVRYDGRNGSPDRWFLRGGTWTLVEFKREDKEPTLQQAREHERLRAHGQPVHVVKTVAEFRRVLATA